MDNQELDLNNAPFLFLQDHPMEINRAVSDALKRGKRTIGCDDQKMKNTFFSQVNMNYINHELKKNVYNKSCEKFIIRSQKFEHLYNIMECIWNEQAQHFLDNQKLQISILNKKVIDFATETIIEEIRSRGKYLRDKFSPLNVLPEPINDSTAGTKGHQPIMAIKYDSESIYKELERYNDPFYSQRVMPSDADIMEEFERNYKNYC